MDINGYLIWMFFEICPEFISKFSKDILKY
jgi:hypothetical protein